MVLIAVVINNLPGGFPFSLFSYNREFLCAVVTFIGLFWGLCSFRTYISRKYGCLPDRWRLFLTFIESRALLLLSIFVVVLILWLGLVIYKNPYQSSYNHGNGAYYAHVLHNICNGLGPEHTTKYLTHRLQNNPYFFASTFSLSPQILPLFVLSPLYWLYPYPPMHVFAMVIVVVLFGSFGVYLAIRAIGGTKTTALFGAVGYCLIPWVELPVLFHGSFDNLGFAVYPYVFAFLFSKRWRLFYVSLIFLAAINIAYAYAVVGLGIVAAVFFKARRQGIIAILIGLIMIWWEMALVGASIRGIWNEQKAPPGFFSQFVLSRDIKSLIKPVLFHIVFIFNLLMTVAFLPLLEIRMRKKWNWQIVGLLFFALIGAAMGLFRSYGWHFHRNPNMVVPIYLSAFIAYINFYKITRASGQSSAVDRRRHVFLAFLLFSSITSLTLWYTTHFPWSGLRHVVNKPRENISRISSLNVLRENSDNEKFKHILATVKKFVPGDASIAYRIEAGLQAFITNRQKAWHIGEHPEGVEYYIVQTKKINYIDINLPPLEEHLKRLENENETFILLYKDDMLVIYKNLHPRPIPRLETILGWDILFKAVIPHNCNNNIPKR